MHFLILGFFNLYGSTEYNIAFYFMFLLQKQIQIYRYCKYQLKTMGNKVFTQQSKASNFLYLDTKQYFEEKEHLSNSPAYGEGILHQLKKTEFRQNIIETSQGTFQKKQLNNFSYHKTYFFKECNIPSNKQKTYRKFAQLYHNLQQQIPTVVKMCNSWFKQQKSGCYSFTKGVFVFQYLHQNLLNQIKTRKISNNYYSEVQITSIADCILAGLILLERTGISLKSLNISDILFDSRNQVYSIGIVRSLFQRDIQQTFTLDCNQKLKENKSNQIQCVTSIGNIMKSCIYLSVTQHYGEWLQQFRNKYSNQLLQMIMKCSQGKIKSYMELFQVLAPIQTNAAILQTEVHQSPKKIQQKTQNCESHKHDTIYNKTRKIIKNIRQKSTDKNPIVQKFFTNSNNSATLNSIKRGFNSRNYQSSKENCKTQSNSKNKLLNRFKHSSGANFHQQAEKQNFKKNNGNQNSGKYVYIDQYCEKTKRCRDMELMRQFYPHKGLNNRGNMSKYVNNRLQQTNYRCNPFENQ